MSAEDIIFFQRFKVREVAMHLAKSGLSAETIREAMLDLAETEAERAIAWAEKYDADEAADREEFADEYAIEARRERERETGT